MKKSSISKLVDFETKYINVISNVYNKYKKQNWTELSDVKFIEELDKFLRLLNNSLIGKIHSFNNMETKYEYKDFNITIDVFKKFIDDYDKFRKNIKDILSNDVQNEYISIIGNEAKRIQEIKKLPKITINIDKLEESGADYEI